MKDVLSELHERQVLLEERIQEYEDLMMEYSEEQKNEKGRKKARHEKLLPPLVQEAPMIVVEVEPAPLECIQRPFHWQAYTKKTDDFLLKMSPGKVSDPVDVQVSKESNGVVHTAKPVPSPMSAQPVSSSTTPLPNNNGKARVHDLPTVFTSIEEHVRVTQFTQGDVDAVFSDSRTDWEKPLLQSILARCPNDDDENDSEQHGASAINALWLTLNSQGDAAKPFLSLDRVPNGWGRYMNTFFDNMQPQETIVTRRKKRDLENAIPLPATADIKVRPPRGVPLLFSPLSQYEDRMLGTLTTETIFKPMEQRDSDLAKDNRLVVSYSYDKGALFIIMDFRACFFINTAMISLSFPTSVGGTQRRRCRLRAVPLTKLRGYRRTEAAAPVFEQRGCNQRVAGRRVGASSSQGSVLTRAGRRRGRAAANR